MSTKTKVFGVLWGGALIVVILFGIQLAYRDYADRHYRCLGYTHDSSGQMLSKTTDHGCSGETDIETKFTYNKFGELEEEKETHFEDEGQNRVYRTVYTYDHMGNLTDEWFYRDHESEIEYENHIQYLHDDQGILLRETHMDLTGSTTHRWDYAYMASDKPTTQTLYRGRSDKVVSSFHYSYDSRGNLIAKAHLDYDRHNTEKDDIGCSKQSFKYSSSGQITESKHDTGCDESIERCQTNEYDSKDRLVREVHYKGECGEVEVWFAYSYESFDEYGNPGERIKD